jgi:hypothetical protein
MGHSSTVLRRMYRMNIDRVKIIVIPTVVGLRELDK